MLQRLQCGSTLTSNVAPAQHCAANAALSKNISTLLCANILHSSTSTGASAESLQPNPRIGAGIGAGIGVCEDWTAKLRKLRDKTTDVCPPCKPKAPRALLPSNLLHPPSQSACFIQSDAHAADPSETKFQTCRGRIVEASPLHLRVWDIFAASSSVHIFHGSS